jgi:hypothetical protein
MEEIVTIKDSRLEDIYNQWITQWKAIEFSKDTKWIDKFKEYQKWKRFWDFWVENIKGRDMNEALEVYKLSNKVE